MPPTAPPRLHHSATARGPGAAADADELACMRRNTKPDVSWPDINITVSLRGRRK